MKRLLVFAALFLCVHHASAQEPKTPSHVYQATQNIIAEIELIRTANNDSKITRIPGIQSGKLPLHVYSKSLEVMEKIARYQNKLGLTPVKVDQIPLETINPSDVYLQTEQLLSELARIKTALRIDTNPTPAQLVKGKGPSDVYENLWRASYMLDGLVGQTSPNEVFLNTLYIREELAQIAKQLGVETRTDPLQPTTGKSPEDVNLEAFKHLHRIGLLERYLEITPIRVPSFPAGDIRPSDVFDSTNVMLAELVRVKVFLGIKTQRSTQARPKDKKPDDVFHQMRFIDNSLLALLASTENR